MNKELQDLTYLYDKLNIPAEGRHLIEHIRHSDPARRVGDGRGNVGGTIPDPEMEVGIQYESRTNERRYALKCIFDPEVFENWDQPTANLLIKYHDVRGRQQSNVHIPDYLTIKSEVIEFVECKMASELVELNAKYPDRFKKDTDGRWISPAGIDACAPYGIGYRVFLPTDIPTKFVRNADFLLDYLRADPDSSEQEGIDEVCRILEKEKAVRLDKLLETTLHPDAVYFAIVTKAVHFAMSDQLLCRPEVSYVFYSETYAEATKLAVDCSCKTTTAHVELEVGAALLWDSKRWQIANFGEAMYTLVSESGQLVRLQELQLGELVRDGTLQPVLAQADAVEEARELLLTASPEDLKEAVRKAKILEQAAQGIKEGVSVSSRTLRHWRKAMQEATLRYGNAFLGLIGRIGNRGWRGSHLNKPMDDEISLSIEQDYLVPSPRNVKGAFDLYVVRCADKGVPHVSYETYRSRVQKVQLELRTQRRHGRKAAYQVVGPLPLPDEAEGVLPTHGDCAFQLTHADHTELPIDLVSSITGQVLGRPWVSVLIDAYSRMVLAYFLSFEPPSYRALMMLFRECGRRYGRFPAQCITDWGPEFESIYFETLLTSHFVERMHRVKGEPRYGSLIEKINATSQSQFVNNLSGNTSNLQMARSLSSTHYPDKHAVWTPDAFDDRLGQWFYDIYPHNRHHGIQERPADRMTRSLATSGTRKIRLFAYDENFLRETLPAPKGGTRQIRRGAITLNNVRYVGAVLDDSTIWGDSVPVRYDPYDISYIYAFVKRRWVRLRTSSQLVLEYTEREIRLAHMEVYARCRDTNREYLSVPQHVIGFLRDVHNQERHLLALRKYNLDRTALEAETTVAMEPRVSESAFATERVPMARLPRKGMKP